MSNDGADTAAKPQRERTSERQGWLGFAAVALLVVYIAIIGVFAIEQIEQQCARDTGSPAQGQQLARGDQFSDTEGTWVSANLV